MEHKHPIQEELQAISPELASSLPEKKAVPIPDPAYFEAFTLKILANVQEKPVIPLPKRNLYPRYVISGLAAAAIIGVLFMLRLEKIHTNTEPDIRMELAAVNQEDLEAFLVNIDPLESSNNDIQQQLMHVDVQEINAFDRYNNFEN